MKTVASFCKFQYATYTIVCIFMGTAHSKSTYFLTNLNFLKPVYIDQLKSTATSSLSHTGDKSESSLANTNDSLLRRIQNSIDENMKFEMDQNFTKYGVYEPLLMSISWKTVRIIRESKNDFLFMISEVSSLFEKFQDDMEKSQENKKTLVNYFKTMNNLREDAIEKLCQVSFMLQELLTNYILISGIYNFEPIWLTVPVSIWKHLEEHSNRIIKHFCEKTEIYQNFHHSCRHADTITKIATINKAHEECFVCESPSVISSNSTKKEFEKNIEQLCIHQNSLYKKISKIVEVNNSSQKYMKSSVKKVKFNLRLMENIITSAKCIYIKDSYKFQNVEHVVSPEGAEANVNTLKRLLKKNMRKIKTLNTILKSLEPFLAVDVASKTPQLIEVLDDNHNLRSSLDRIILLVHQCNVLFTPSMFEIKSSASLESVKKQIKQLNLTFLFDECGNEDAATAILVSFIMDNLLLVNKELPQIIDQVLDENFWANIEKKTGEFGINNDLLKDYKKDVDKVIDYQNSKLPQILQLVNELEKLVSIEFDFDTNKKLVSQKIKDLINQWYPAKLDDLQS